MGDANGFANHAKMSNTYLDALNIPENEKAHTKLVEPVQWRSESHACAQVVSPLAAYVREGSIQKRNSFLSINFFKSSILPLYSDATDLVHTIFSAIKYTHDCDIVHCDLKPENLLFHSKSEQSLEIMFADFGLSRVTWFQVEYAHRCLWNTWCTFISLHLIYPSLTWDIVYGPWDLQAEYAQHFISYLLQSNALQLVMANLSTCGSWAS